MTARGTKFEVTVEKLVYGGDGMSRRDGAAVFTPYVLPGERVEVEAEKANPGVLRTRLLQVLEAAPERVAARCPYFTWCGGCSYQHAPYEYQLQAKRQILAETLRRIGKIELSAEIGVVAGEPWNYRNRVTLHVRKNRIGYLEARSHILCAVDQCHISSPKINGVLAALVEMARERGRWPDFLRAIEIFTNETDVQLNVDAERPVARRFFDWCGERIPRMVSGALDYPVDGVTWRVSPTSFFQVNRFLIGRLAETALEGVEGERALDLYAGAGLFAVPLAQRFREVTAVELGAAAARDLAWNAEHAGARVTVVKADAAAYLQQVTEAPDLVLLDPPRAGMGKDVVRRLGELKPPTIVIVSCDPATLARDLAGLMAAGYRIDRLTLVDLFPQTFHLETVAKLRYGS